jgi:alpha-tubulin suppressor-like RCC1 family protein
VSKTVVAIAVGGEHTCALTNSGAVKCWGYNHYGQLGDGTTTESHAPVPVRRLPKGVVAISAGGYHTCALTKGGAAKCWGYNGYGQLGDGTHTDRHKPVQVHGLSGGVRSISAGTNENGDSVDHTCTLTRGGAVKCWGYNGYGQLGDGTQHNRSKPVPVLGFAARKP